MNTIPAKESRYSILIFLLIVAAAIYLRFDRLTSIPPSLSHDETAIAYNAYSILKTGRDEYGTAYPLLFRSFDDYKLPGMVYATVPSVALFGRTEIAARVPSAVFGVLAVIVMYGISIELFGVSRWVRIGKNRYDAALIPVFMFAVSPWHINFSRQLFESNGAVFWFMFGTYFLLLSRKRYMNVIWAGLSFVASLYFYYSVRLVIPFIVLLYIFMQWRSIRKDWKISVAATFICIMTFFPMGKEMLSKGGMERISIVSVIHDPNYVSLNETYVRKLGTNPSFITKLLYNRRVALIRTVLDNYGKNISPKNLFLTGTGTYGALYPFEMFLIPVGIYALSFLSPFAGLTVLVWVLTAFLPGAFSINQPNTLRTLVAAPAFAILSGLGVWFLLLKTGRIRLGLPAIMITVILLLLFLRAFPKFRYAYFTDNPTNNALSFGDGYKQLVSYVSEHEAAYDRIYISGYYWRPYIFMLYWHAIDPLYYQKTGTREGFGKYVFTSAPWDTSGIKMSDRSFRPDILPHDGKTLFILSKTEFDLHQQDFRLISYINGVRTERVFAAVVLK